MLNPQALQLRVGVDVGSQCHSVAVGLTDGSLLEEFEIIKRCKYWHRIYRHRRPPVLMSDVRKFPARNDVTTSPLIFGAVVGQAVGLFETTERR